MGPFTAVSVGGSHACVLRPDGVPICWGWDVYGQASPPDGERFMAISCGDIHTCALRQDGTAVCWGHDGFGEASPPSGIRFAAISSGGIHTCALRQDGAPVCWGSDRHGQATPPQLGAGQPTLTNSPADYVDNHAGDIDDYADVLESAAVIDVGATISGAIDYYGDVDAFRFSAQEGRVYQVDAEFGTDVSLYVTLRERSGLVLASEGNYGGSGGSSLWRIVWKAPSTGEFNITMEGDPVKSTGTYNLAISTTNPADDYADTVDAAAPIQVGTLHGSIDYLGDVDVFRFTPQEGQLYQVNIEIGSLLGYPLKLLDSNGGFLSDNSNVQDPGASRIVWEASSAGDYHIAVDPSRYTGSYSLTVSLSGISDDHAGYVADATAIVVGTPVPGAIDYVGDADVFHFTAEEGQAYQLDVDIGTLKTSSLELQDSGGFFLASDDSLGASRIVWEAPSAGDYHAVVRGQGYTGSYILTVSPST
ncbi:MAG: hypothetical protein F4X98_17105 [Gammaproteobacteria bacterium]|nr:hypothetical protein [Gammaproteobacteria bacterium]